MRYLRTNTATRITVGPFFDKTDGVTPEVALTVTSEKLTFMVDTAGVPTLILDVAPTASAGANDMVHVTGDDAGFYDLELAAADVNYLGRAMLALTDAATHCPVFHEFMILPAMIYDAMVLGTDVLQADVTQLLGTAWLTPGVAGTPDVNAKQIGGTAQTGNDVGADVNDILVDTGTTLDGRIPAALIGGKMDANIGSKTVGLALTAQEKADVNAEVVDTLNVDTYAEPGQEAPPATTTLVKKIGYLYKAFRNKITQTATTLSLFNDDAATVDQKATVSDDATTFTRGEIGTGP